MSDRFSGDMPTKGLPDSPGGVADKGKDGLGIPANPDSDFAPTDPINKTKNK